MSWTQQNELQCIHSLGAAQPLMSKVSGRAKAERTVRIVEGYIRALPHRHRWFTGVKIEALHTAAEKKLQSAYAVLSRERLKRQGVPA